MGLIWVSVHMQRYTASWIKNQVRCVFIIFSILWDILCGNQQVMGKFTFAFIYALHVDSTGLFIH